jgi:hypothetical protein
MTASDTTAAGAIERIASAVATLKAVIAGAAAGANPGWGFKSDREDGRTRFLLGSGARGVYSIR